MPIHLTRHCRALPLELFAIILKRGGNAGLSVDIVVGMKRGRELGAHLSILHSHTRRIVEFKIKIESNADIRYVFPLEYPMFNLARFCAVIAVTNRALQIPSIIFPSYRNQTQRAMARHSALSQLALILFISNSTL